MKLGQVAAGRCRRRVHLDHDPDADRTRQRPPDAGLQLRRRTLDSHRARVHDRLAAAMTLSETWTPDCADRPAAMWAPRLVTETRIGTPDLLLRDAAGGYIPVLVRGHRTIGVGSGAVWTDLDSLAGWAAGGIDAAGTSRRGRLPVTRSTTHKARPHHADTLALAHLYRMLQELGLASREKRGGIIGFGGPSTDPTWSDGAIVLWHRLDVPIGGCGAGAAAGSVGRTVLADYDERFADRLAVATAAAARRPALAVPSKVSECRSCPWWSVCGPELEAAHDVSLLVAGSDVAVLRAAGAERYDDVAAMDPDRLAALPLTGIPPAEARIRARALAASVPLVRRRGHSDPTRADVELDVDMESYQDDGAYLWGTYLSGEPVDGFTAGYRPFVTWDGLDTEAAATNFVAFWAYLTSLRRACGRTGRSFAAYCYSHQAEERWLYGTPARFPHVAGMPDRGQIAAFCRSTQWVDLYVEVKRLFVVPGSLRLKAVAPIAGFSWRDPEPGGENSMAWYRIATGQDPARPDEIAAHRQRILRYNEDDVCATACLRQWISDTTDDVPTVTQLNARFDAASAR